MSERMTEARRIELNNKAEWDAKDAVDACVELREAMVSEVAKDAVIKALADYISSRAGHEENCRGWRRPVRRDEWMDITSCTCGPGDLLRRAGRIT